MNYLGSKTRLLPFIQDTIIKIAGSDLSSYSFCDLFAGTGAVNRYFRSSVKHLIINDREYYSYVINKAHCCHIPVEQYSEMLQLLNKLAGTKGFIYTEYAEKGTAGRLYFSGQNGMKIDAIRQRIEEWKLEGQISDEGYFWLLASLILAADKVANTTSIYGAYLKQIKPSAKKPLQLSPVPLDIIQSNSHKVFKQDSNLLISDIEGDLLYLDPPYNRREYAANYHLLNTIALYDTTFTPAGKSGLRSYTTSQYCRKAEAAMALHSLISKARFRYIFLSYNDEGIITPGQIREMMQSFGIYKKFTKVYQRFRSNKRIAHKHSTIEYIHALVKS